MYCALAHHGWRGYCRCWWRQAGQALETARGLGRAGAGLPLRPFFQPVHATRSPVHRGPEGTWHMALLDSLQGWAGSARPEADADAEALLAGGAENAGELARWRQIAAAAGVLVRGDMCLANTNMQESG